MPRKDAYCIRVTFGRASIFLEVIMSLVRTISRKDRGRIRRGTLRYAQCERRAVPVKIDRGIPRDYTPGMPTISILSF